MEDFLLDFKEESIFLSWETRVDSLLCDLPMFISKLSECKQVDLYAAFITAFDIYFSP